MRFNKGQAVTHGGEAWTIIDVNTETAQYQVQSLDGTRSGWLDSDQVISAP